MKLTTFLLKLYWNRAMFFQSTRVKFYHGQNANMTNQKKIVQNLKRYKPEKMILFGNYAWGKPNQDSDMDILIVKKTAQKHYERIPEARRYLYDLDQAFDILVLTPEEVEKRLALGDFFIQEIWEKGKVLYEKREKQKVSRGMV